MTDLLRGTFPEATDIVDPTPVIGPELQPVPSLLEEAAQERELDQNPLGFDSGRTTVDDVIGAAIETEWVSSYLIDRLGTDKFTPDFNYDPNNFTKEERAALDLDNRPKEFLQDLLTNSVSFAHAQAMARVQDQQLKALQILERSGAGGMVARVAAAFLDPTAIALTVATDGLAAPFVFASKASRLSRAVRGGLLAASSNAALEAAIAANDPLRDESDVTIAALTGLVFGSAVGGFMGPAPRAEIETLRTAKAILGREALESVAVETGIKAGLGVTEKTPWRSIVTLDDEGNPTLVTPPKLAPDILPAIQAEGPTSRLNWFLPAISERGPVSRLVGPATKEPTGIIEELPVSRLTPEDVNLRVGLDKRINETTAAYSRTAQQIASLRKKSDDAYDAGNRAEALQLRAEADTLAAQAKTVGRELEGLHAQRVALKPSSQKAEDAEPDLAPGDETKPPVPPMKVGGAVGASDAPYVNPMLSNRQEGAQSTWRAGRVDSRDVTLQFDLYSSLARSAHDGLSWLVDRLTPNPSGVRRYTGRVQARTVTEDKEMIHKELLGEAFRTYNAAFNAWAKQTGRRLPTLNINARREFGEMVGRAVRGSADEVSEDVERAAEAVRSFHLRYLDYAKKAGLVGFENVDANANYLLRSVNYTRLYNALETYGSNVVERLIANAIRNAPGRTVPVKDEAAQAMAYVYLKWLKVSAWNTDGGMSLAFNAGTVAKLRKRLMSAIASDKIDDSLRALIDEDMIDDLIDSVKNVGQMGVISRGKFRIEMNELESVELGNGQRLSMTDFLENDAERLMLRYSSEMSGAVALARNPDLQIKSMSHWEQLEKDLEATAQGYMGRDHSQFEKEMKGLEVLRRHLFGQPLHDLTARDATLFRILRDYNFTRLMNRVGLAQIAEFGTALGQVGFRAMMQHLPMLAKIRRDALTGKFNDELADEIDAIGIGIDREIGHPSSRDMEFADPQSQRLAKVEDVLSVGKRITATYSGLAPITEGLERIAAAAALQKLANIAKGSAKLSKQRLLAMGLDEKGAEKVFEQMRKHAGKMTAGATGRKIRTLNLSEWDADARELLKTAVWRWTRRMIQRNDIGDLPLFMSKPLGQLFFQFRSFTFAAWSKQLMHGLRMADAQTVMSFASSTVFGSLGYIALISANAAGRDDAQEYLEKNLTPERIGLMGWARAGWTSMLPPFVDTGMMFMGEPSLFQSARTTGLDSNWLLGSPSVDLVTSGIRAAQGLANAPRDGWDYSQQDARALKSLLLLQNAFIISNGAEALISELPKRSRYDN